MQSAVHLQVRLIAKPEAMDIGRGSQAKAKILHPSPVPCVVAALKPGPGVVGDLIPLKPMAVKILLCQVIHLTLFLFIGQQLRMAMIPAVKRRTLLDHQAVGRDVLRL